MSRRTTAQGDAFTTAVRIGARNLPGPVPLDITLVHAAGRREERTVSLPPAGGTFTIETKASPRRVEVNGRGGLLAVVVVKH